MNTQQAIATFKEALMNSNETAPLITEDHWKKLLQAQLFTNHGTTTNYQFDPTEVRQVGRQTTYLPEYPSTVSKPIYRISVGPETPSLIHDSNGRIVRTHMGVNFNTIETKSPKVWLPGVEMSWGIRTETIEQLVSEEAHCIFSCKGYVHPKLIRTIVGWKQIPGSNEKRLITSPGTLHEELDLPQNQALWINVPRGALNKIDYSPNLTTMRLTSQEVTLIENFRAGNRH